MSWIVFPPGLILVFGGLVLPFFGASGRRVIVLGLPLLTLWALWSVPDGPVLTARLLEYDVVLVEGDPLSRLFGTIFAIMAAAGGLFALSNARTIELCASMVYAGASLGVIFAGDLITLFVFWELMAVGSTLVLWSAGTVSAFRASMRYLAIHLLGGVVLMAGIAAWVGSTGEVGFARMTEALSDGGLKAAGAWLILAGFLLNAGAPPLSAWLPDAYPEASPSGMVTLSAFTTKTAVYVLIVGFAGTQLLVWIGLYMIFYGIIYALLENDMRRILAYSIVNQVGFMVTGIGIGTVMSLNGSAAHAFTHIIYKALLLMSAGAVLHMTGRRKCSDLGGLIQTMPLTATCGIIGALAISSFPLTSGFISKSMISQAAMDGHMTFVWMALAAASAGVFLHAGIKFPWFVFFQADSGLRPSEPPMGMRVAMVIFAALCILLGVAPGMLYEILPAPVDYVPYTGEHVVAQLQLLLFSGLAFFALLPLMKRTLTISLDWDWFYRCFGPMLARAMGSVILSADRVFRAAFLDLLRRGLDGVRSCSGPDSVAARSWTTAAMVLSAVIALGLFLLLLYT